jgi:hypothetical protein
MFRRPILVAHHEWINPLGAQSNRTSLIPWIDVQRAVYAHVRFGREMDPGRLLHDYIHFPVAEGDHPPGVDTVDQIELSNVIGAGLAGWDHSFKDSSFAVPPRGPRREVIGGSNVAQLDALIEPRLPEPGQRGQTKADADRRNGGQEAEGTMTAKGGIHFVHSPRLVRSRPHNTADAPAASVMSFRRTRA